MARSNKGPSSSTKHRIRCGHGPLGQEVADTPVGGVDLGGGVALGRPAGPEHGVRGVPGRTPQGQPVSEEVPDGGGDDVRGRLLGGGHHHDAGGPSSGHDVPEQLDEPVPGLALALGVEGQLVDDHHDEAQAGGLVDLAQSPFEEEGVALLHLGLELAQGLGRRLDVGTDEPAGRAASRRPVRPACRRSTTARLSGSRAAAATTRDRAFDFPAPGSPPNSRWWPASSRMTSSLSSS